MGVSRTVTVESHSIGYCTEKEHGNLYLGESHGAELG